MTSMPPAEAYAAGRRSGIMRRPANRRLAGPVLAAAAALNIAAGILVAAAEPIGSWALPAALFAIVAAVAAIVLAALLHARAVRPLERLRAVAARLAHDPATADEAVGSLDALVSNLEHSVGALQQDGLRVALAAAHMRKVITDGQTNVESQEQLADQISRSSEETSTAIDDITARTATITSTNSRNLDHARESQQGLNETADQHRLQQQPHQGFPDHGPGTAEHLGIRAESAADGSGIFQADQHAGAERLHRGGPGRRTGTGIRRGRGRSAGPGREGTPGCRSDRHPGVLHELGDRRDRPGHLGNRRPDPRPPGTR